MRLLPRFSAGPALALALGGLLADARPASAAWDNVFQVCCNSCGGARSSFFAPSAPAPSVSFSAPACPTCPTACAPACPQACPQPQMRVSYVQRCFYQPVTEFQRQSYYEPVQRTVTSFYQEPVTTYRYTTYFDPCTGCPQRVCQPVTSFVLRQRCNSVTSYVQRCALVPVTTLRPVTVQQPVVSYYFPEPAACAPAPSCDGCGTGGSGTAPQVTESREVPSALPPAPAPSASGDTIAPPQPMVPTSPGMSRPKMLPPVTTPSNVRLRPERTTGFDGLHLVRGEIVKNDQVTPRPNAKLVFVNARDSKIRQYNNANAYGEFEVKLATGDWYLYVESGDGKATFHKKITLGDRDSYTYTLVSR